MLNHKLIPVFLINVFVLFSLACGGGGSAGSEKSDILLDSLISDNNPGKLKFQIDLSNYLRSKPLGSVDEIDKVTVHISHLDLKYEFTLTKISNTEYEGYLEGLPLEKELVVDVYAWKGSVLLFEGQAITNLSDSIIVDLPVVMMPIDDGGGINQTPIIKRVVIGSAIVATDSSIQLQVEAVDPDGNGDSLSYTWSSEQGHFETSIHEKSVFWKSPSESGSYSISIHVSDQSASTSFTFSVITELGSINPQVVFAPYISGFNTSWDSQTFTIKPQITNPSGYSLSYSWERSDDKTILGNEKDISLICENDSFNFDLKLTLHFNNTYQTNTYFPLSKNQKPILEFNNELKGHNIISLGSGTKFKKNYFSGNIKELSSAVLLDINDQTWYLNGNTLVLNKVLNSSVIPNSIKEFNQSLYFGGLGSQGTELYKSNPDSDEPILVSDIYKKVGEFEQSSFPAKFLSSDNLLYFSAQTSEGFYWHVLDNNDQIINLYIPSQIEDTNGEYALVYNGNVHMNGYGQLWESQGTVPSSKKVLTQNDNEIYTKNLTVFDNSLFAFESVPLMKINSEGEQIILDNFSRFLGKNDNKLFYRHSGLKIFEAGSDLPLTVYDNLYVQPSQNYSFPVMNGELFFPGDNGLNGIELWKSDGTFEGTKMISNLVAVGSSEPEYIIQIGNKLFFSAFTDLLPGKKYLFETDGTEEGTELVKNENESPFSNPKDLMNINGRLLFISEESLYILTLNQ